MEDLREIGEAEEVDESILRMRTLIGTWLASESWDAKQLVDWLQGYDLPPVGHDEEPYIWLLRGLPDEDERYDAEEKLAARVGNLLLHEPDVNPLGTRPNQVLYNLLMLAAGLSCPDQLASPLKQMLRRRRLKGNWLGIDLRSALRSALILNQKDEELQPLWETFLVKGGHEFLPGNAFDCFEAVRLMPESESRRGEPALNAIGKTLKVIAAHLHENQAQEFYALINKLVETYPGRPTWQSDLLTQALRQEWPRWTIQSIPGPYFEYISRMLRESPYSCPRSEAGVIAHALAQIESQIPKEHPEAKSIEEAHKTSLKTLAVGV